MASSAVSASSAPSASPSPAARGVAAWHRLLRAMSPDALDAILHDDVVFHSPVVHTPQRGRDITRLYLLAAFDVLPGDAASAAAHAPSSMPGAGAEDGKGAAFRYVREIVGEHDALLEFMTEIDGIVVNGVDLIRFDDDARIVEFKVMLRPLKAVQKVHARMGAMLERMKS